MVSLSRLFHKTDEREKPATAATAPAEPACAPTAKATVAPVELPQEFLDIAEEFRSVCKKRHEVYERTGVCTPL